MPSGRRCGIKSLVLPNSMGSIFATSLAAALASEGRSLLSTAITRETHGPVEAGCRVGLWRPPGEVRRRRKTFWSPSSCGNRRSTTAPPLARKSGSSRWEEGLRHDQTGALSCFCVGEARPGAQLKSAIEVAQISPSGACHWAEGGAFLALAPWLRSHRVCRDCRCY